MTIGLRVLFATADRTLAKGLHRGSPHTLHCCRLLWVLQRYICTVPQPASQSVTTRLQVLFVLQTTRSLATTNPSLMIILYSMCSAVPVMGSYIPRVRGLFRKQYRTTYKTSEAVIVADSHYQSPEFGIRSKLSRIQARRFCSSQVVR